MKPYTDQRRKLIMAVIYLGLSIFFALAFYERFWAWRHEIAEVKSSFITPEGANLTSAGAFWICPALAFLGLSISKIFSLRLGSKRETA